MLQLVRDETNKERQWLRGGNLSMQWQWRQKPAGGGDFGQELWPHCGLEGCAFKFCGNWAGLCSPGVAENWREASPYYARLRCAIFLQKFG